MNFSGIQQHWQRALSTLYPPRESANLFRFVLGDIFGLSSAEQILVRDTDPSPDTVLQLERILERLKTGEPLQYITGFTYFDELKIAVSPAVLIPRPETEELVQWIVESVPNDFSGNITDWCTGSGCIALALKNRLPKAQITGIDYSEAALNVARANAHELGLGLVFGQDDALAETSGPQIVDIIVSNPPYIPENEHTSMRSNVIEFEPHMALFVPDGDAQLFYAAITQKAAGQMVSGGILFFELHEDYAHETRQLVERTGAFHSVEIRKDLSGKDRMLRAVKK